MWSRPTISFVFIAPFRQACLISKCLFPSKMEFLTPSPPSSPSFHKKEVGAASDISQIWKRTQISAQSALDGEYRAKKTKKFREKFLETLLRHVTPEVSQSRRSAGKVTYSLPTVEKGLPKDVEDLLCEGLPVEALSIALELKKSSEGQQTSTTSQPSAAVGSEGTFFGGLKETSSSGGQEQVDKQRLATLLRKLVARWISEHYTAECLIFFALVGDNAPWAVSERNNFLRLIFALPETFVLSKNDFLSYSLNQVLLAVTTLAHGVKDDFYKGTIHSQPVATFLDKLVLRFHSDEDNFYGPDATNTNQNKFFQFVELGAERWKDDFVARRLLGKVLKGLGTHAATKLGRTLFLVGRKDTCPALIFLHPPEEFLDKSSAWRHILRSSIPLKTPTRNKVFWANWAFFIASSTTSTEIIVAVWKNGVSNWQSLCGSSVVNNDTLIPATYALVALARQIRERFGSDTAKVLVDAVKVFASVAKCLDSTVDEKRACGMALAQVMGDLHTIPCTKENDKTEAEEKQEKLKFSCEHAVFKEIIQFYEKGLEETLSEEELTQSVKNLRVKEEIEVLDSDDDIMENLETDEEDVDSDEDNQEDGEPEVPINETVMSLRSRKVKMPVYFSDIVEVLVEGGDQKSSKSESDTEALKYIAVMRIPLLLMSKVQIDGRMARVLSKALVEFESLERLMDIPVLFALYELANAHPSEVFETLAQSSFDSEHYTTGQRMNLLRMYADIIQLLSNGKCFFCFHHICLKNRKEWGSYCYQFVSKYCDAQKFTSKFCAQCKKNPELKILQTQEEPSDCFDDSGRPLGWREIVDRRIEAKTRYFASDKRKNKNKSVPVNQAYSTKLVPIAWLSVANRLMSRISRFMDAEERKIHGGSNDMLLSQVFRLLGRIILETGSSACPHLGTIASQVGELVRVFIPHEDPHVRQSVLALLAVTISITDGAPHIIEAVAGGSNMIANLKFLREKETFQDNKNMLDHLLAFVMHAVSLNYKLNFDITSGLSDVPRSLRIVKDDL